MTEILLVLATGVAHLLSEALLGGKGPFIAGAAVFWIAYVAVRLRREPGLARAWGWRADTLRPAGLACGAVLVLGAAGMLGFGAARGRLPPPAGFWFTLPLYPLWGILQQFLLNSLLARNLAARLPRPAAVLVAALLFGLVHLPGAALAALTFAAALLWVPIFLRWPNVVAPGVCHGLLGALAYYIVLGRDVWGEVAGG